MMLFSFPLAFVVIRTVKETNYEVEETVYVDDTPSGATTPVAHHHVDPEKASQGH